MGGGYGRGSAGKFVDSLYRVLTATNAKTLTDLTRDRNWFWTLMTNSEISQSRKTVIAGLSQLTGEAGRLWIESILPVLKNKKLPDLGVKTESEVAPPAAKKLTSAQAISALREGAAVVKQKAVSIKPPQKQDK